MKRSTHMAADDRPVPRERDCTDIIDAAMDHVLSTASHSARDDCPEIDALAAWYDAPHSRTHRLDEHLADCRRCQSIVAAIARAEDEASPARSAEKWHRLIDTRMMAPALAAIAALIVVVVGLRPFGNEAHAPSLAPAGEASSMSPSSSSSTTVKEPAQFVTGELEVTPGASLVDRMKTTMATLRSPETGAIVVASPDRSVEWLIGKHGVILRRDSDRRVSSQPSGVVTDLTAGAAVSPTICWVIGNSGTVLRTTDGQHWETMPAPTALDLISVSARSADAAMVVAAGGPTYYTIDGGRTWIRR